VDYSNAKSKSRVETELSASLRAVESSSLVFLYGEIATLVDERVCLFTHFDYENIIDNYVIDLVKAIDDCGLKIVFISTCTTLSNESIEKLSKYCHAIVTRENRGLDFGGWAEVLSTFPQLFDSKQLLLTNDSVYLLSSGLKSFFRNMGRRSSDFWGMTESYQISPHLQSYFLVFEKPVLRSDSFKRFWHNFEHVEYKQQLIERYELGLTSLLTKHGFSYSSALDGKVKCGDLKNYELINPVHHLWKELVVYCGVPIVKVELLRNNPFNAALEGIEGMCRKQGGDFLVITEHLNRVSQYYKVENNSAKVNAALVGVVNDIKGKFVEEEQRKRRRTVIIKHAVKRIISNPLILLRVAKKTIGVMVSTFRGEMVRSFEDNHAIYLANNLSDSEAGMVIKEYRAALSEEDLVDMQEADTFAIRQHEKLNEIAVVCHVFYPDLYPEIVLTLRRLASVDVYISLVEGYSDCLKPVIEKDFPNSYIQIFKNHGRDIYPFLKFVQSGKLFDYAAVLKIHSKASKNSTTEYDFDGDTWRKEIFSDLVPEAGLSELISSFISSRTTGMLCPKDYVFGAEHLGSNEKHLHMLCSILGMTFDVKDLEFAGGSMFWIKPWLLRHVAALGLEAKDFPVEPLPVDGSLAHALERAIGVFVRKAGYKISSPADLMLEALVPVPAGNVDLIAFYLPQFHPIKENDLWWGKGFTEWKNVARAVKMFDSHRQPRIPEELGYYDLRMPEVQQKQASLAREYGLSAFCFYHYWFSGEQLLVDPIDSFLDNSAIDFKFLLCWANENWTRSWDGMNKNILKEQLYTDGWGREYASSILKYITSNKYYTRDEKPVLLIYNVSAIPQCKSAMNDIRDYFRENGVSEIEIVAVWFYGVELDIELYGVDSFSEFSPHRLDFVGIDVQQIDGLNADFKGNIYSYEAVAQGKIGKVQSGENEDLSLGVMCGWDNTARRMEKSDIFHGSTPAMFRNWLNESYRYSLSKSVAASSTEMLFINAWNEWAEGTYLEPDTVYGRAYLEAVKSVIK
jgi:lipopolysaccharide biosynthesis protein